MRKGESVFWFLLGLHIDSEDRHLGWPFKMEHLSIGVIGVKEI